MLNLKRAKMVLHEAILPTVEDTEDSLKEKCFEVIQAQLNRDNLVNDTHED